MNKPAKITAPFQSLDYEKDGYGWAMEQGRLLRARQSDLIDWDNIAEEIESMGRSERGRYRSHLVQVLMHMLKWEVQPERRGMSWWLSIVNNRDEATEVLEDNPSLKPLLDEIHAAAMKTARRKAALETNIEEGVFDEIEISVIEAFDRAYPRPEGR